MQTKDGRYICDAEMGSVKRGWHSCCRKAVTSVTRWLGGGKGCYTLHYCARHEKRVQDKPKCCVRQQVEKL